MGKSKLKKKLKQEGESAEKSTSTKVPIDNLPQKFLWMHVSFWTLQSYKIYSFIHRTYFKRWRAAQKSEMFSTMRWRNSPIIIALFGLELDRVLQKPFLARNSSRGSMKASTKSQNYVIWSKFVKTSVNGQYWCNTSVQLSFDFRPENPKEDITTETHQIPEVHILLTKYIKDTTELGWEIFN